MVWDCVTVSKINLCHFGKLRERDDNKESFPMELIVDQREIWKRRIKLSGSSKMVVCFKIFYRFGSLEKSFKLSKT